MRYYMIEREADEEDDPCRIYLELNDSGVIQRKAEVYLNGIYPRRPGRTDIGRPAPDPDGPAVRRDLVSGPGDAQRHHGTVLLNGKKDPRRSCRGSFCAVGKRLSGSGRRSG